MRKDKLYYIEKYVMLCGSLCKVATDYTRAKVKKHNKAMQQLILLEEELSGEIGLAEEVYDSLLNSTDNYVRQSAATDCLRFNIHTERAIAELEYICANGERMAAMGADRILRIWRGELDPSKPF